MGGEDLYLCDSGFPEPSASATGFPRRTKRSHNAANQIHVRAAASPPSRGPSTFQRTQSPSPGHGGPGLHRRPQSEGGSADVLRKYRGVPRDTAEQASPGGHSAFLFHRDGRSLWKTSPTTMAEPRLTGRKGEASGCNSLQGLKPRLSPPQPVSEWSSPHTTTQGPAHPDSPRMLTFPVRPHRPTQAGMYPKWLARVPTNENTRQAW